MEDVRTRAGGLGTRLLLIAAALAIPVIVFLNKQSRESIAFNEREASMAIKRLTTAQADYRANDRDENRIQDFWTGDVAGLFKYGLVPREVAEADARPLHPLVPAPIPYHGYFFVAMTRDESEKPPEPLQRETDKRSGKVHHLERFGFSAYPAAYGETGRTTYIVNQNNTVRWQHRDIGAMNHWPSDDDLRHDWALGD